MSASVESAYDGETSESSASVQTEDENDQLYLQAEADEGEPSESSASERTESSNVYTRAAFTPPSFNFGDDQTVGSVATESAAASGQDETASADRSKKDEECTPEDKKEEEVVPEDKKEEENQVYPVDEAEAAMHVEEEDQKLAHVVEEEIPPTGDENGEDTGRAEEEEADFGYFPEDGTGAPGEGESPEQAVDEPEEEDKADGYLVPPAAVTTIPEVEPEDRDIRETNEQFENEELEKARGRIRCLFWHICCLWIIILVFVVLLVVFGSDDDDANETRSFSSPTEPPSMIPSSAPTSQATLAPVETVPTLAPSSPPPTEEPRTEAPTIIPLQCFQSREELEAGLDLWFEGDPNDELKNTYGWPIGNWCMDGITNFNNLFSVQRIGDWAGTFNEPLKSWDLSAATDMGSMFDGCTTFNQDLTSWDVSRNRNLTRTFAACRNFNGDITSWSTGAVTEMRGTFFLASLFNQDISGWDVSNVESMRAAFLQAEKFNQDLSPWRPVKVTSMNSMFFGATAFSQNLCNWPISLGLGFDARDVFVGTACPLGDSPTHLLAPVLTPFCFSCDIVFDTICEKLWDCTVLYEEGSPQTLAFNWLRDTNVDLLTATKIIQRYALATLYFAADGENWFDTDFWLTPIDECLWYSSRGFACNEDREIVTLGLDSNGLFGELPLDISLLTSLRTLSLNNNTLFGPIPPDWGRLSSLETLELNSNFLEGTVPGEFGDLENLELLRLDDNDLTGTLPDRVCSLTGPEVDATVFLDCVEVPASCETDLTCCSNEAPCL